MSFLRNGWGRKSHDSKRDRRQSVAIPFVKAKSALPMGVNRAVALKLREPLDPRNNKNMLPGRCTDIFVSVFKSPSPNIEAP
jgi:hypothetical protein